MLHEHAGIQVLVREQRLLLIVLGVADAAFDERKIEDARRRRAFADKRQVSAIGGLRHASSPARYHDADVFTKGSQPSVPAEFFCTASASTAPQTGYRRGMGRKNLHPRATVSGAASTIG